MLSALMNWLLASSESMFQFLIPSLSILWTLIVVKAFLVSNFAQRLEEDVWHDWLRRLQP